MVVRKIVSQLTRHLEVESGPSASQLAATGENTSEAEEAQPKARTHEDSMRVREDELDVQQAEAPLKLSLKGKPARILLVTGLFRHQIYIRPAFIKLLVLVRAAFHGKR